MKKNACLLILVSLLLVFSCKPQVPGKYIQPDEFEDILYDYHLADAMAENNEGAENNQYDIALYRQTVLRKYNVTQAEFDSSLVYYMRHADRLHKIYENLSKRLSDEAMALGASANDISRYGDMKSAKDTSNLWTGVSSCVLMSEAPYNVMSFDITADSTYHKGDRIIFSFNSNFIFKEGVKEGIAMLAVQFENDSVASSTVHISSNSNYSVTVSDGHNNGIKAIRGFVYLDKKFSEEKRNSLKLMFVDGIRLVRMRAKGNTLAKPEGGRTVGKPDSVSGQNIPADSRKSGNVVDKPAMQAGKNLKQMQRMNAPVPLRHLNSQQIIQAKERAD